jgi:hypothetical protein
VPWKQTLAIWRISTITTCTVSRRKGDAVPTVFVDTVAWIVLLNRSDALRPRTLEVMATLRQQKTHLVTTDLVLLEVADALSTPRFRFQDQIHPSTICFSFLILDGEGDSSVSKHLLLTKPNSNLPHQCIIALVESSKELFNA